MSDLLCPVCRAPKKVEVSGRLPWTHHARIALAVGLVSYALSSWVSLETAIKSLTLYFPLWGLTELVHYLRLRKSLECRVCGFDPQLYRRDWRAARARVESRLGEAQKKLLEDFKARRARLKNATAPSAAPSASPSPNPSPQLAPTRVVSLREPNSRP